MSTKPLKVAVVLTLLSMLFILAAQASMFGWWSKPKPLPAGVKDSILLLLNNGLERLNIMATAQVGDIFMDPVGNQYTMDAQTLTDINSEVTNINNLIAQIQAIP